MSKMRFLLWLYFVLLSVGTYGQNKATQGVALPGQAFNSPYLSLAGTWRFKEDAENVGITDRWYAKAFTDSIQIPGSMSVNNKGNAVDVNTPWTGSIFDSSWFFKPQYAKYRKKDNIKIPFWLQPDKYYVGAAWYQKQITIPEHWKNRHVELFIERSHWQTTVWVNNVKVGNENSLSTAQVFDLSQFKPGTYTLTVRIDNKINDVNVGPNAHSISDHTQTNWNGMVGDILLRARPECHIGSVRLFTDIASRTVNVKVKIRNAAKAEKMALQVYATDASGKTRNWPRLNKTVTIEQLDNEYTLVYTMGDKAALWDEFNPQLYDLHITLNQPGGATDNKVIRFGFREVKTRDSYITVNGNRVFLRGTLESAIFPLTGYPATDTASWGSICRIVKAHGLNHIRFHSWCPPEAAFAAADKAGIYLQVECASWANWGTSLGDGAAIDTYIYDESERIVRDYGNHPSFCFLTYGNEPGGKYHKKYLAALVEHWKKSDTRFLYTSGAGWPAIAENDYHVISQPRIQQWEAGLTSVINREQPRTDYDWRDTLARFNKPVVSHEIGQWCVFPDFKEMAKYTGVLKARNFEIFNETLNEHGLGHLADSFLLASGKLQALCYKADIEAALRTPGFAGFQLLDLHDFPGQGSALVGVLNAFWEEKGYINAEEYSRFCNATVPLVRFPKMVFLNNESLELPVELAHFGAEKLTNVRPVWEIRKGNKTLLKQQLPAFSAGRGNCIPLGTIRHSLAAYSNAEELTLRVTVGKFYNEWNFYVYPSQPPAAGNAIFVTQQLDKAAMEKLQAGGKVLLTLKKGSVAANKGGDIAVGFSSIFWNTAWTNGQAPHTLGVLCNPLHPALQQFPTSYHSSWQWWDAMSHADAIILDSVAKGLVPVVRVIDDWVTSRSLGLIFECKVGNGSLLVSGIDLLSDAAERPAARQLLASLQQYMESSAFRPDVAADAGNLRRLVK